MTGEGVTTLTPAVVYRLVPADQARFDVLVSNDNGAGNATVQIKDSDGNIVGTSSGWPITPLRQTWTADESVLSTHEPPTWVGLFPSVRGDRIDCRSSGAKQNMEYCE